MMLAGLPHRLRPRYVLKRELSWDPCLDVVGHRVPNAFVDRHAGDPAEVDKVRALAGNLGDRDMVVIYPEGTRFSHARRERLIQRLQDRGSERAELAAELQHCLPPRPGGSLALFEAAPEATVWVLGHTGFEGSRRLGDLARGALTGAHIRVRWWATPVRALPTSSAGRRRWLDQRWRELDRWVGAQRAAAR